MTKYRIRELLVAGRERVLLVVGSCLLTLALQACQTPSLSEREAPTVAQADAPSASPIVVDGSSPADVVDSAVSQVCQAGGETPSKGKGESCACDYECRTGHCAHGVCCTAACTDRCKACNLPSSLGDCSFVQAGVSPADPAQCQVSDPTSCGQDGKCDGKGGCQLHQAETVCSRGTCEGDGLAGVKVCDGKGNCSGDRSETCAPYSCNAELDECHSLCAGDFQCAVGQKCVSESCGVKLNGYKCKQDSECASGHCSGGICCNYACNGPCVSCALTGSFGRCRLVPAGQPHPQCEKRAESTCGTTGLCDGTGACALWPANTTPCRSATCSGSALLTTTAVCDGKGTCKAPTLVDCSPYLCVSGQCNRSCKSDGDCEPGHACLVGGDGVGKCSGKQQLGQPCDSPESCDSGYCVDGACCESACEGACRSCALSGSPGRCTDLPAGAHDPRAICVDQGAESCGRTGLCDGVGGCQIYPADSTKCGPASCDDQDIFTEASTCNQAGQCVASSSRSCYPYVCNGTSCLTSCSKDSDCAPPNTCTNSSCGKAGIGAECSSAVECLSGFCAQGVCCNTACDGTCKACNLVSRSGFCSTVPDGSPDPQGQCAPAAVSTCGISGMCKGGGCALFDTGTPCGEASCATSSSVNPAATCDGQGACVAPGEASCGGFLCTQNACLGTCRTDADCAPPNTCVNSSCGLRQNGAACTKAEQCGSGFCTEGVCCDSPCADDTHDSLCMSCKVRGKVGTCSAVPNGWADPKQRCVASNPTLGDCSNDGTCNGKGGCRPWSSTVGCRAASCTDSLYTPASNCDGEGHCPDSEVRSCNPYRCGTGAFCLTTCKTAADCVEGESCLPGGTCQKLPNGSSCSTGVACQSGNCVNAACCEAATCDDQVACTTDSCANSQGECRHTLYAASCLIDHVCYAVNAVNPTNSCQICDPSRSQTGWSPRSVGTICRPQSDGGCDVAETCDGTGAACPADKVVGVGTVCRPALEGGCDVAEACDGKLPSCPADKVVEEGVECRAAAEGGCDVAEKCNGKSPACPEDKVLEEGAVCREAEDLCQQDATCSGSPLTCPPNPPVVCPPSPCHSVECVAAEGCVYTELCPPLECDSDGKCVEVVGP